MVLSTQISRLSDGLPLAQSVDDSSTEATLSEYKQQAKLLLRRITPTSAPTCTIDSGPSYSLHYLISPPPNAAGNLNTTSVVFLTIAQRSYPRKLAFAYLDELAKEFVMNYGSQIGQRNLRPYAFVGFDTFMQRTKRLYADSRTATTALEEKQANAAAAAGSVGGEGTGQAGGTKDHLGRLNEDLQDVTRIMTKNMEDLLWRGDSLDQMSSMSSSLRDESLKYRKAARQINIDAMIRKYAPIGAIAFLFIFIIWIRFF
jgi:vesicle transport protein SEC22